MSERLSLAGFDETIRLVLDSGGEFTIWPKGRSMLPCIRQDRDSVVPVSPGRGLKKGDIALYQRENGSYVLHRVISCRNGCCTICGDSQLRPEPGVRHDRVIAVVSRINRRGRSLSVRSLPYRLYVLVWSFFPVRRVCLSLHGRLNKLRRSLRGR